MSSCCKCDKVTSCVSSRAPPKKHRLHLKASTQRVSVALRRATSDAVLVFNQVAEAYPAVPLGGVAAAPPEDAAEAAEGDDEEEDEGAE